MRDPYEVLGVSKGASDLEIKKAYKQLAKQLHPDKHQGSKVKEEKFKEVNDAYEKVKDAKVRKSYEDENLARQFGQGGYGGGGRAGNPFANSSGFNFSQAGAEIDPEILSQIFGGMGGDFFSGKRAGASKRTRRHEQEDAEAKIELGFWEAITGGSRRVSLPAGVDLEINIPAGIKSGQKIRLKGQASKINPHSQGDLLLQVEVKEIPGVTRQGDDIIVDLDVPVDIAIKGGEVLFSTPLGKFNLTIASYTNSGKRFRFSGKGAKGKGDLYARVNLILPENKKEALQDLFSAYAK